MQILSTPRFRSWLASLKDDVGRARVSSFVSRWQRSGLVSGDVKSVGEGVYEARVHAGPGYRIYFAQKKDIVVVLLVGGSKRRQSKDIETARQLLDEMKKDGEW